MQEIHEKLYRKGYPNNSETSPPPTVAKRAETLKRNGKAKIQSIKQ